MQRIEFLPIAGVVTASVAVGHLGILLLPGELLGLPTPLVVIGAMIGSVVAALRFL
jgi:hypothetical protein